MADERGIKQELESLHMDLMRLAYHARIIQTQLDTTWDVLDTANRSIARILDHVFNADVPVGGSEPVSDIKPKRQGDMY